MMPVDTKLLKRQGDKFCRLLDNELFFEAHEALEEIWFAHRFTKDNEIRLIRSYINAAVSFELIKRGRVTAATKPWSFFEKHSELIQFSPDKHSIHYAKIYKKIIETFTKIR